MGLPRTLLPTRPLDLGRNSNAYHTVMWLELLQCLGRIVDQREAGRLATTKLGA